MNRKEHSAAKPQPKERGLQSAGRLINEQGWGIVQRVLSELTFRRINSALRKSSRFATILADSGTAQRSRNQIVLVLLLVLVRHCPISDYEHEDDEDERFARPSTIWPDTDRLASQRPGAIEFLLAPRRS